MEKKLKIIALIALALAAGGGLIAVETRKEIRLDIAVTNPSAEESQEVDVRVDLPKELKKEDIISADGLEIKHDPDSSCYVVEGKVNLQPSETTFYYITVNDVWVIPPEEIKKVRELGIRHPDVYTSEAAKRIEEMLSSRNNALSATIDSHIALYRKQRKELDDIKGELQNAAANSSGTTPAQQKIVLVMISVAFVLVFLFGGLWGKDVAAFLKNKFREIPLIQRRRFPRLPDRLEVNCRLWAAGTLGSLGSTKDVSRGGFSVVIDRPYPPHSAVELKIKLPGSDDTLTFSGFVAWAKKIMTPDNRECYLTGISLAEASQADSRKLKEYISSLTKS